MLISNFLKTRTLSFGPQRRNHFRFLSTTECEWKMAEITEGAPVAADNNENMDETKPFNNTSDEEEDGEEMEEELYEVERIVGISKAGVSYLFPAINPGG